MPYLNDQSFNDTLTKNIVSFKQLGPEQSLELVRTKHYIREGILIIFITPAYKV